MQKRGGVFHSHEREKSVSASLRLSHARTHSSRMRLPALLAAALAAAAAVSGVKREERSDARPPCAAARQATSLWRARVSCLVTPHPGPRLV